MSKRTLDTMFRQAFDGWKPEAPPRRQNFDGQMRSAFSSFAPTPSRSWVALRSVPTSRAKPSWIAVGYVGALALAVLIGLARSESVDPLRSVSTEEPVFMPEGPRWKEPALQDALADNPSETHSRKGAAMAIRTGSRNKEAALVGSDVSGLLAVEQEARVDFPAGEGLEVDKSLLLSETGPMAILELEANGQGIEVAEGLLLGEAGQVMQEESDANMEPAGSELPLLNGGHRPEAERPDLLADADSVSDVAAQDLEVETGAEPSLSHSRLGKEGGNVAGVAVERRWRMDVRTGLNWGLVHGQHALPQQVSLDENSEARIRSSEWHLQVGVERRLGAGFALNTGLRIQRELQHFNRAALQYAPLNSVASGPVHSNILSPMGPVSGLGMEVDYFAPEGEAYSLNADSWLQAPMLGLELELIEVSAAVGLSFRSGEKKGHRPGDWSWRAEALFMPGLVLSQGAEVYSALDRSEAGEIQGLRTLTLRGAVSAAVVYGGLKGISFYVGPSAFVRLQSANSLPGSSGVPLGLGFQGGILF
jgi:hypothetical protein